MKTKCMFGKFFHRLDKSVKQWQKSNEFYCSRYYSVNYIVLKDIQLVWDWHEENHVCVNKF